MSRIPTHTVEDAPSASRPLLQKVVEATPMGRPAKRVQTRKHEIYFAPASCLAAFGPHPIVTPKLDRMFRSASDALTTLEELKAQGTGLVMLDLGGDVTTNGISKLVFTILSAVAENERERIRDRIREVKRHLASQGVYGGGRVPFGCNVVDGKLVENPQQQAILKATQADRASGDSYRKIGEEHGLQPMTIKRILDRIPD